MRSQTFLSRVLPISSLLLIVLFKFQNCAPVNPSAQATESVDGEVRIVDRWSQERVSFISSNTVVSESNPSVDLQGLCVGSSNDQQIDYQVIELAETPVLVASGTVKCVMGGFELPLDDVKFSSCQSRYQVRAGRAGDAVVYAETLLVPECAARAQASI